MTDITMAAVLEYNGCDLSRVREYGWRSVKCPFHDDHVASGRVNLECNAYACMACDVRGDAIGVIKTSEHLDFRGALEWAGQVLDASGRSVQHTARRSQAAKRRTWLPDLFDAACG